jgi:DNA topoisomerase VI subunit B
MSYELNRIMAEIPRAAEYFSIKELQAQTGQPFQNFASVIVKELIDNALDASESLVQPEVELDITEKPDYYIISVRDYGPGFPEEAITGILDFYNRVSTKTIYAAPTRGAQGNALKTVIGIPIAMNCSEPILIESGGKKHILSAFMDPAGAVRTQHSVKSSCGSLLGGVLG